MNLPGEKRRLSWDRGKAEIWALSGAVHHLEFRLPDGRTVRPLAEAPWHGDAATTGDQTIPPHLRFLGGEWPCVPFGRTDADPVVHGFGTDNLWAWEDETTGSASLSIAYPWSHAVAHLTRTVSAVPGHPRLDFTLTAEARADGLLPVGLHPIFALGQPGEEVRVEGAFAHGETFPVVFEPGVSRLAPAARFATPDGLPLADGGTISFGGLLNATTEEAFQLFGVDGTLRIVYPQSGYAVRLTWNPGDFPTVLFWVSTGGRTHKPWSGRFRGFGVEPLNARFEERAGQGIIAGGRRFLAGETWTTHYSLAVDPL